jgi:hypothetical protein
MVLKAHKGLRVFPEMMAQMELRDLRASRGQ